MSNKDDLPRPKQWIIPFLLGNARLSGTIGKIKTDKNGDYICFIDPLNQGLLTSNGKEIDQFFCYLGKTAEDSKHQTLREDNFVSFLWKNFREDTVAEDIEKIQEEEARNLSKIIQQKIEEQLERECKKEHKIKEQELDFREEEIQQKEKKLENEKDKINQEHQQNQACLNNLKIKEHNLNVGQSLINQIFQEIEHYGILDNNLRKGQINSQFKPLPRNFGENWTQSLNDNGLYVKKSIADSFLISILSALYLGRLVLLNGTVGVGKTSIIKHSANILGCQSNIIPVRPAWLDPSDLLGFYDPLQESFRPTPFLSALNEAKKDNKNRLHLVCLDELNLAKIENYASDVLSCLEYSQIGESFKLYAEEIEKNLEEELKQLYEQEKNDKLQFKEQLRLRVLQELLVNYPANFRIPENIVLLGTLNSDETTYDLSPKLIDRSFIINYPAAELPQQLPSNFKLNPKTNESQNSSYYSIAEKVENLQINLNDSTIQEYWNLINQWNNNFLKKGLGIPLGYRIFGDYKIFLSVGTYLGFSDEESFGYFIFTKILPRIKFFKDEENRKVKLLEEWIKELKPYENYDPANIIEKLLCQINQEQEQYISYWNYSELENFDSKNNLLNSSNLPPYIPSPQINDASEENLDDIPF
jgi:hypothetical protein